MKKQDVKFIHEILPKIQTMWKIGFVHELHGTEYTKVYLIE